MNTVCVIEAAGNVVSICCAAHPDHVGGYMLPLPVPTLADPGGGIKALEKFSKLRTVV